MENYGIVATGTTQTEAISAYKKLLAQNGVKDAQDVKKTQITVTDIRIVTVESESTIYFTASDRTLYKARIANDESLLLIQASDIVNVLILRQEQTESV